MSAAAAVVLFLFLCSTISAVAEQKKYQISLDSSLSPTTNSTWLSSSRIFAFGFYLTPKGYAICIFFASIFEKTVVWTANTDHPIVPDYAVLLLTTDGLVFQEMISTTDSFSKPIYWHHNSSRPVAGASMLDNGNFVLYDSYGSVSWQSFDHPSNCLVPGQRLSPGAELLSRASKTDLSNGIFRLEMQTDGNLVLYSVGSPYDIKDAYYQSGTNGRGSNVSLNLESDGHLYLFDGTSVVLNITMGGHPTKGTVYLMRIDVDGIFRVYNRSLKQDDGWKSIWSMTEDKCLPKGLCGINSYCTYKDENADCECIPGYDPVSSGVGSNGCTCNYKVDCSEKNQINKFEMRRIQNVTWEENYDSLSNGTSEEQCEKACLNDCSCNVAIFIDGECRKPKLPLRYGRWQKSTSDIVFVRVAKSTPGHKMRLTNLKKHVITGVSLGIFGPLILFIILYYITRKCGWYNQSKKIKQSLDTFVLKHGSLSPKRYTYCEIKKIANSFTDKIGQGGYGIVYKGKLTDGQLVAVKVLQKTHDNAEEFVNEVASISRTSHVNIVNLLGFCYERNKKALVYEFMSNKSLDKFIYKSESSDPNCSLEWKTLHEIAVGVARGLEYLHKGCNTRIVHFDIKPQNILLDKEFCPKISDFGLAKLCIKKQSIISMLGTRGTIGYIAPEVYSRNFGLVSHKSDVYSYGIMLLRMVEARTNVETKSLQLSENYFLENIYDRVLVENEKIYALISEEEEEVARKMLIVGFWCSQTAPSDRPSMNKVVDMLQGNLQTIQIPPAPFILSSPKLQVAFSHSVILEMCKF